MSRQVFVTSLSGRTLAFDVDLSSSSFSLSESIEMKIKHQIQVLEGIPLDHQLLMFTRSSLINSICSCSASVSEHYEPLFAKLSLRLEGGKGGFGSLLRGQATVSGQRDIGHGDMRDLQGRRMRHIEQAQAIQGQTSELSEPVHTFSKKSSQQTQNISSASKKRPKHCKYAFDCKNSECKFIHPPSRLLNLPKRKNNDDSSDSQDQLSLKRARVGRKDETEEKFAHDESSSLEQTLSIAQAVLVSRTSVVPAVVSDNTLSSADSSSNKSPGLDHQSEPQSAQLTVAIWKQDDFDWD